MSYIERSQLLSSSAFLSQCRIALCDWAQYWAVNGTSEIEDETVRNNTEAMIRMILEELDDITSKVAVLAISDSAIATIESEGPTDQEVHTAINSIMANALEYLI